MRAYPAQTANRRRRPAINWPETELVRDYSRLLKQQLRYWRKVQAQEATQS